MQSRRPVPSAHHRSLCLLCPGASMMRLLSKGRDTSSRRVGEPRNLVPCISRAVLEDVAARSGTARGRELRREFPLLFTCFAHRTLVSLRFLTRRKAVGCPPLWVVSRVLLIAACACSLTAGDSWKPAGVGGRAFGILRVFPPSIAFIFTGTCRILVLAFSRIGWPRTPKRYTSLCLLPLPPLFHLSTKRSHVFRVKQ